VHQAAVVGQRDGLALARVQHRHAAVDLRALQAVVELRVGLPGGVGLQLHRLVVQFHRGVARGLAAAQLVDGLVAHDVDQPGHGRRQRAVVAGGPVPDVHEGFLQHVFGPVAALQHAHRQAQQVRRRGAVQLLEGSTVLQRGARQPMRQVILRRHGCIHLPARG
jgi:hypothetical protein